MSPDLKEWGQVSRDKRTEKDRVYIEILKKRGELTNTELRKAASDNSLFKDLSDVAKEKDVDRFIKRAEYLGILLRENGKLRLLISSALARNDNSRPGVGKLVLDKEGFITSRAGLRCRHCMKLIDLTQVGVWRRLKSDTLLRMLHVHHFFWVTRPHCGVKARFDMKEDVKPILPDFVQQPP